MSVYTELPNLLRDLNQNQKVKFLNRFRDRVAKDKVNPKVSDFDLLIFIVDYPTLTWKIAKDILDEK